MKSLKLSFSLLVHNKIVLVLNQVISKIDCMYCVLEAEVNNGVAFTLSEDELLKVGRIQYKLVCFKAIR